MAYDRIQFFGPRERRTCFSSTTSSSSALGRWRRLLFGRQRLLFSLVRHSKWMLRDTWALVWVKTNGQFGANGDGRVFYRVFWKLFPTLGVGFSVELTTFVCPPHSADWLRCLCARAPHFTGPSKRPRSGTFPRNTTTATMCYINFTLTLYNYLPSLSIWCSRRSQV